MSDYLSAASIAVGLLAVLLTILALFPALLEVVGRSGRATTVRTIKQLKLLAILATTGGIGSACATVLLLLHVVRAQHTVNAMSIGLCILIASVLLAGALIPILAARVLAPRDV